MDNPTIKGNYTKQDVRDYAYFRKASEIEGIEILLNDKKIKNGEIALDEHEDYREPLAFSRQTVISIELSTGGDADGFKLVFDEHKTLIKGLYYWADWGVYEEVSLSDDELDLVDQVYCVSDSLE